MFLDSVYNPEQINESFQFLIDEKLIFLLDRYYSLSNEISLVHRRKKGNERAAKQLRIAKRLAGFLSRFPFVRGVAVSGSLSKNFADKQSDIDFFIITKKDRLWIARTFMHLFKKLTYFVGKQHWFCMNYYIDESALEIREKNIFTATEVVTVLRFQGEEAFRNFMTANEWALKFYPHYLPESNVLKRIKKGFIKPAIEFLFNNRIGEQLDSWLMKITSRRWHRKTERQKKNKQGLLMGMDAGKHYSKADPKIFQEQVLRQFNFNKDRVFQRLGTVSSAEAI